MDPEVLHKLEGATLRGLLPGFLASQVQTGDGRRVAALIEPWSDAELDGLLGQLRALGREHRVYPAIPRCRELARAWMQDVLEPSVTGVEHLADAMGRGRTVIVTNHLSYLDATATDVMLAWGGHPELADRIAYLAGPKVYQELFRLVAAAAIHTLPVPQSAQVAQPDGSVAAEADGPHAGLSPREIARRVLATLDAGESALSEGLALLFYPEGSRTRSGRLEPFLKGTHRYLRTAEYVVPGAISGTERVMPLDGRVLVPGRVSLAFGPPIPVAGEGDGDGEHGARSRANGLDALAQAHEAIAALLPPERRPVSGQPALR